MAAKDVVGTIRKVGIDGVIYRVPMDVNVTHIFTRWQNENIATSGKSMRKMTRRSPNVEGLVLLTNADEAAALKTAAESLDNVPLSLTTAAGDTYRAEGVIEFENRESEEGRTAIQLLPTEDWQPFVGEVS